MYGSLARLPGRILLSVHMRNLCPVGRDEIHKNKIKLVEHKLLLLFLRTQICFLIGGKLVTCRGSKLTNSLGRTKLTNSLGNQQLVHLETAGKLCTSRSDVSAVEVGQRFLLDTVFIIQEKGFIIAKTYQINRRENMNVFCLQGFSFVAR